MHLFLEKGTIGGISYISKRYSKSDGNTEIMYCNWLRKYVDFNTDKRKQSTDEFNKNLCKLLNNCIYGKSIENQRKRINVKLINGKKNILKMC